LRHEAETGGWRLKRRLDLVENICGGEDDPPVRLRLAHQYSVATGRDNMAPCGVTLCQDSRRSMMATGTVKWFNPTKGYGFIQPQGGGQDVFVHISAVERAGLSTLNEGQQVEYEIVSNRGKSSAENLKVK
jgi:CspA family cold shock protein